MKLHLCIQQLADRRIESALKQSKGNNASEANARMKRVINHNYACCEIDNSWIDQEERVNVH